MLLHCLILVNNESLPRIPISKTYLINDSRCEQTLQLTEGQLLMFDGMSMRGNWRELGVDWLIKPSTVHQNLKKPDIAGLGVSTIVVSPKYSPLFLNDFSKNVELLCSDTVISN